MRIAIAATLCCLCAQVGVTVADDDPLSYADVHTGRPKDIKCPDARPCVIDYDSAFWVFARGWKRHYTLDRADVNSALRAGAADKLAVDKRVDAAVRAILKLHKAKTAAIECGVAGSVPSLVGSKTGDVEVTVPATKAAADLPTVLTPEEADQAWLKARAPVDADTSSSRSRVTTLFAGVDTTAMTEATFERPHLRWRNAWVSHKACQGDKCTEAEMIDASMLVIYSPESTKVYLLDRSVTQPTKQWRREAQKRANADQDAVFATLTALGIKRIVIDADSICAVPRVAGKGGWFTLK
jgi:hypothetical protein